MWTDKNPLDAYDPSISSSARQEFLALSFVWRHGLGSTTEEGLALCQLKRLSHRLFTEGLYADTQSNGVSGQSMMSRLFWIDSLCIPGSPKHRSSAISHINQVFQGASAVLVIDGALERLDCSA